MEIFEGLDGTQVAVFEIIPRKTKKLGKEILLQRDPFKQVLEKVESLYPSPVLSVGIYLLFFFNLTLLLVVSIVTGLRIKWEDQLRETFLILFPIYVFTNVLYLIGSPIEKRKRKKAHKLICEVLREANKDELRRNQYWEFFDDKLFLHYGPRETRDQTREEQLEPNQNS